MRGGDDERREMGDGTDRACGRVASLRRAGRLDAARALARRELGRHPGDERVSRALSWVICDHVRALSDSPADEFDPSALTADLRELAGLALPEDGNDVLYRNLVRRLASLAWGLRRAGGDSALRDCLGVLASTTRVTPNAEWRAKGSPRSDGQTVELCAREAQELLRPFLSALGGPPRTWRRSRSGRGPPHSQRPRTSGTASGTTSARWAGRRAQPPTSPRPRSTLSGRARGTGRWG